MVELEAARRFVGLEVNAKKTEAITMGLKPIKKNNADAEQERFSVAGNEDAAGWLVEWDGVDLRDEWARAARRCARGASGRVSHLIAWDNGKRSACDYGQNGRAAIGGGRGCVLPDPNGASAVRRGKQKQAPL